MTETSDGVGAIIAAVVIAGSIILYARLRYDNFATRAPAGQWQFSFWPLRLRRDSAFINRAGPSANFCEEFNHVLSRGPSVIIPAGDGCYPDRIPAEKQRAWSEALEKVIEKGGSIDLLVTAPGERATEIWMPLVAKLDRFRLVLLDQKALPDSLKVEAERLDTFHPVLFFEGKVGDVHVKPLGMWIETFHPLGYGDAFGIEVVGEKSVQSDPRFSFYLKLLRDIINSPAARKVERLHTDAIAAAPKAA